MEARALQRNMGLIASLVLLLLSPGVVTQGTEAEIVIGGGEHTDLINT